MKPAMYRRNSWLPTGGWFPTVLDEWLNTDVMNSANNVLMKANINTTVSPIVGTERQSEELVMYLLDGFDDDPKKIWESNIFGKSLHELVNEGLHSKLAGYTEDNLRHLGDNYQDAEFQHFFKKTYPTNELV